MSGCSLLGEKSGKARPSTPRASRLIAAARQQISITRMYDQSYSKLGYPNGDVDRHKGACTDVLIRAYRDALQIDLQKQVHEDMSAHFDVYPQRWHLPAPDQNIDHRRVPNLECFFARNGAKLPLPRRPIDWQPGDIFTTGSTHIGLVTDMIAPNSEPFVIHNWGYGVNEENVWWRMHITARYRYLLD